MSKKIKYQIEPDGNFPILDNKDVKGGIFSVMTKTQMLNGIPLSKRVLTADQATIVHVATEKLFYRLVNNPNTDITTGSDWEVAFDISSQQIPLGTWDADNTTPILSDATATNNTNSYYFVVGAEAPIQVQYSGLFGGDEVTVKTGYWIYSNGSQWIVIPVTYDVFIPSEIVIDQLTDANGKILNSYLPNIATDIADFSGGTFGSGDYVFPARVDADGYYFNESDTGFGVSGGDLFISLLGTTKMTFESNRIRSTVDLFPLGAGIDLGALTSPWDNIFANTFMLNASAGLSDLPLTFYDDQDTGIYRRGTNTIGFAAGGVNVGSIGNLKGWILPSNANPDANLTLPENGSIAYDSTDHDIRAYVDGAWTSLLGGGSSVSDFSGGTFGAGNYVFPDDVLLNDSNSRLRFTGNGKDFIFGQTSAVPDYFYFWLQGGSRLAFRVSHTTGEFDFSFNVLSAVGDPLDQNDATNKQYVDNAILNKGLDIAPARKELSSSSSESLGGGSIAFNDDGTKVYFGANSRQVRQYSCSTAYDISTATLDGNYTVASASFGGLVESILFNSDGTKAFLFSQVSDLCEVVSLSTAYDFGSTVTLDSTTTWVNADIEQVQSACFSNNGSRLYILDKHGSDNFSRILQYNLSPSYTLPSTLTTPDETIEFRRDIHRTYSQHVSGGGITFDDTGHYFYVFPSGNSSVSNQDQKFLYVFFCPTAWDIGKARPIDCIVITDIIGGLNQYLDAKFYDGKLYYTRGTSAPGATEVLSISEFEDRRMTRDVEEITIASGKIKINSEYVIVDTEASAASDDLDIIEGGVHGDKVYIMQVNNARQVIVRDVEDGNNSRELWPNAESMTPIINIRGEWTWAAK